ncbi:MAG: TIGR01777 family oxidoreductase [Myxococcota bacterium]
MRVFMTGATGFIGQALVKRLRADGHDQVAWVRDKSRARALLGDDVELVETSEDDDRLSEALQTCDAVVNLAGAPVVARWTESYRKALTTSRVDLTQRLTDAMAHSNIRALISSSAVGFYGDRGDERLTEQSTPAEGFLAKLCVDWEQAAVDGAPESCRVVILRTGIVLGKGGGALDKMLLPFKAGLGGPIGTGRQMMPWIHLDDMVQIIVTAIEDEAYRGVFNASAPTPVTNRVFSKSLGRALGRPAVMWVPTMGLKVIYGEAASVVVASQNAVPEALLAKGFQFSYPEIDGALSAICS